MVFFQKRLLCLLVLLALFTPCFAGDLKQIFTRNIYLDFQPAEDSLCFTNNGFTPSAGYDPMMQLLARVADGYGACQGMVGLAAAVKKNVIFRPNRERMSNWSIINTLSTAQKLHYADCSKKLPIDGYANLRELCQDYEGTLRRQALAYNSQIATNDIVKYAWSYFNQNVVSTPAEISQHLKEHLTSIYEDLKKGRYPLMLVRYHVTLVTGITIERDDDGNPTTITLTHYDPNDLMSSEEDFRSRSFSIDSDGQISGQLIWNITSRPSILTMCFLI